MKSLILYYSRTGITKKVANSMSKELKCDIEEIVDLKDRSGPIGYIIAGKDAVLKKTTKIKPISKKIENYDMIIIGGPVWANTMANGSMTFLKNNKSKIKNIAFFCTMGGSGDEKSFTNMSKVVKKKPVATLSLLTKEVIKKQYAKKVSAFIKKISVSKK